ncbi:efflux RND transporter permease subunit [Paracoccus thiocyanatus]|uniref:CusA/CzcA family heavy metal efflux RND transporter n=1 Tax=Paracoccus thiocyanatus TaxID=34006 RepID=A0A3D8PEP5_9RHOB|nr:efflux RND transporter permease subunit [Paracoccus thiocyanatus]RDW14540.1 CusA/CzcA family heavy metal efflux RND transporter [Paracoccus thiocyanatus]
MFDRIIRASLRFRFTVIVLYAALMIVAAAVLPRMPVDVFPEFAPPQIQVQTEAPGFPSEDVETLVTRPIETALQGMPLVEQLRSVSSVGLSRVTIVFQPGIDIYDARMLTQERLQTAMTQLPDGVEPPRMMPMTSAVSWLQKFALVDWSQNPDPLRLRALADWDFRNALLAQPGVAEVVAQGGGVKQYQVLVDVTKLRRYDLSFDDVVAAARQANLILPGAFLEPSRDEEYFLRVDGRARTPEEIGRTQIALRDGVPLLLADVAQVVNGPEIKRGDAQMAGGSAVIGTVSKLWGADTLDTSRAVQSALDRLAQTLPPDIQLIPNVFRQASSIERSIENLRGAMIEAVIIVALILALLIGRWRPTVISLVAIPISLTVGALILWMLGIGINALTLGGLIFAVGEVVDDAIIDVENIIRRARETRSQGQRVPLLQTVFEGSSEIRNSVVFATGIVIIAFAPIFFLSEIEGRLFAPMAIAYIAAVLGSLFVALSLVPVLSYFALRRGGGRDLEPSRAALWLHRGYGRLIGRVVDHGRPAIILSLAGTVVAALLLVTAAREFLPQQAEGNVIIATTAMPGTSLAENMRLGTQIERIVSAVPGVVSVSQRAGRSRLDEDAQPVNFAEFDVTLDPELRDAAGAIEQIRTALAEVPGVAVNVSQFITHRMQEILSGVRAQVVIKVFGADLATLEHLQGDIIQAVSGIPGIVDLQPEPLLLIPGYDIRVDRANAAVYGLSPGEIVRQVGQALNGIAVSKVVEGDRSFDLVVRGDEASRKTVEAIARMPLRSSAGATVPVSAVASIAPTQDRYQIAHEDGQRRAVVQWNTTGDLGRVIAAAEAAIAEQVALPPGYRLVFDGDWVGQQRASANLAWSGSLSILMILLLLGLAFRTPAFAALVALNVPFALLGGALVLRLGGESLNVASTVGLIALAGVAARNGILLLSRYEVLESDTSLSPREIALQGARDRLLPIVMTALTTAIAVIPLMLGDPVGKEYQRAIALVLFGGMMSSLVLNLLLVPPLYLALRRRIPVSQAQTPPLTA